MNDKTADKEVDFYFLSGGFFFFSVGKNQDFSLLKKISSLC
ncbi:hypothetical protein D920_00681 [Enterococcus faecalis 13-SD-W-01]|nr:hypothetical protein D920_00681 [Enterococcus faecalis 13-SD-W-01]